MRLNGRANFSQTRGLLQKRARGFNSNAIEFLKRAGREIAVSLATSTIPYGVSQNARKLGETAVQRDIARVYVSESKVYKSFPNQRHANAFSAAMHRRNYTQAQSIVDAYNPTYRRIPIRSFDGGSAHQAARKKGRVPAKQRPVMIVQADRRLDTYVRKEMGNVGEAKGGWAAAAISVGGNARGLPQWITRHATNGGALEDYSGRIKRITLFSNVRYALDALSRGEKEVAIRTGFERMLRGIITAERAGQSAHAGE